MDVNRRYRPNTREIAHKVLDGEAVLMNLSDGTYYSMNQSGTLVWQLLEAGYSGSDIVTLICRHWHRDDDTVRSDLNRFLQELQQQHLIQPVADSADKEDPPPFPSTYEAPVLEIYRDMADLLALDPPMPRIDDATPQNE